MYTVPNLSLSLTHTHMHTHTHTHTHTYTHTHTHTHIHTYMHSTTLGIIIAQRAIVTITITEAIPPHIITAQAPPTHTITAVAVTTHDPRLLVPPLVVVGAGRRRGQRALQADLLVMRYMWESIS